MKTLSLVGLTATVLVASIAAATLTQTPAVELKVGDQAPAFALAGSDGKTHRLSDYKGRAVVLAWFPKAFTGG
jgi:peroxiredoxin Q/BCP